jgi:ABC-2 type transport system ATP-binding protein
MPRFYRSWDPAAFNRYLGDFGLGDKKKIKQFSRGMKMKFSLAVALSHNAELIIMDEPTSGLDPVFRHEMLTILAGIIQDENKAVLFSSHITSDLEKIADYVTLINEGRIIFSENKDSVLKQYSVIQGPKADLKPDMKGRLIGLHYGAFGFEGLCPDIESIRPHLSSPCVVERASLEQIMIYFVRDGQGQN